MATPAATVHRADTPLRRLARDRRATVSAALLLGMLAACWLTLPWTATAMRMQRLDAAGLPPSLAHPLGTDPLGRDMLARTLYGGATSLALGLLAAAVSVTIGAAVGLVAGYAGGWIDSLLMRLVDTLYALPSLLIVMLLTMTLGGWLERASLPIAGGARLGAEWARFIVLAVAIGSVSWLTTARVVRGEVLSLRERAFVEAARVLGASTSRVLLRHLLPNLLGPITVFGTLAVPAAILQESFLSFLGIGVQPPQATWGSLAAEGAQMVNPVVFPWWLVLAPCAALSITLLALHLYGEALRDALDRRLTRS